MISAEQARKNVELNKAKTAEIKQKKAEEFINHVVDPQITEASVRGECNIIIDMMHGMEVISEIIGMIQSAGFVVERGRSDTSVRISWYEPDEATPHNSAKAVVIVRK